MSDVAAVRAAWIDFCADIERLGLDLLELHAPATADEAAETLHYLTRILRGGLDYRLDGRDHQRPHLHWYDRTTCGAGGFAPNLDNTYLRARIDGRETYRLTMTTGTYDEVNVAVHAGSPLDGTFSVHGDLTLDDLEIVERRIEIVLSGDEHPGNWISMPANADWLFIRFYYFDWEKGSPPEVTLDRMAPTPSLPHWPAPLVIDGLADAVAWTRQTIVGTQGWKDRFLGRAAAPNAFFAPAPEPGGPPQILYGGARAELGEEDALVMEFDPPLSRAWVVGWSRLPWGDSPDLLRQTTSLNHVQTRTDGDGRVRIVFSGRDPGVENWIDTGGRRDGIILYRWLWSDNAPVPAGRVVPVSSVREVLPAGTPPFSATERAAQLQLRRSHLARRF